MKFWGLRVGETIVPEGDEFIAEFEKIPTGKQLQVEVTQPRNPKFSRLYWALCARVGKGIGRDAEWVSDALKVETGHVTVYKYGGKEHLVLGSIAFHKFDEIAFKAFFENCIEIIYRVWQIDPASVADLLVPEESQRDR